MNAHPLNGESIHAFLRSYVAAFNSCDGAAISAHYAYPSLSLRGDGTLSLLNSREQAEPFFTSMARTYSEQGCVDSRADNVKVHSIGSGCALVTVDWSMLRSDGSPLRTWTHSYNVLADGDRTLFLLATFNFS
jgi:ketosteroid isomerase-like protein